MVLSNRPAPAAARPPRFPVDPSALAARVAEYQRSGVLTPDLAAALTGIAAGVHARCGYGPSGDDFVQDCLLHFLGWPLRRCVPGRDALGWLTESAIGLGDRMRSQRAADERRAAEYRADVGRALVQKLASGDGDDAEPPD